MRSPNPVEKRGVPTEKRSKVPYGFHWGELLPGAERFSSKRIGREVEIEALQPTYLSQNSVCDLIHQYEKARKAPSKGRQANGKDLPHVRFANAKTVDDLIEFVSTFGPIVARSCKQVWVREDGEPKFMVLKARQNIEELRNEQKIYRSALTLMAEAAKDDSKYDIELAKQEMAEISRYIVDWPAQWDREKVARQREPRWRATAESIERIRSVALLPRNPILSPQVDARIILCELLNAFPGIAFANLLEMHSDIRFGIRPLLYSVLRKELFEGRETAICANSRCRSFFDIERTGQKYCTPDCSRQQRQRDYWKVHGNARRRERKSVKKNLRGSLKTSRQNGRKIAK